ncbi:hypothetical protein RPB_2077 [Rhodopseudomonas palustris HaA2]|uniref:Uncharacterized protein n=1 Tax=Rhodopseudomonas palustris (strain HaA2) TaxID=316058 RepID=Q2IYC7_RHOP2|nr:hypothetical protein [Rhodopseudomonas palustris]ABD06783.1 hypothetical protein RPB_2077 [Rhodopseudomonas palustris HaA2]
MRNFNRDDRSMIRASCSSGDELLIEVRGAGVARPDAGDIVALGDEAVSAAALYAELTGRRYMVTTTAGADALARCKVIVALTARIDDEMIDALYGERRDAYPGLIIGATPERLRRRLLSCAAALAAGGEDRPHRVELIPGLDIETMTAADSTLLGRRSRPDEIRTALGRGDSVVLIHGHGDGIDGDLGPLILCPVDDVWRARPPDAAPVCRITARCYRNRHHLGSDAHRAAQLTVSQIAARVLIWNTCIGFPSQHGLVGRVWGAGVLLAESPSIAALLTTWRITMAPATLPAALLDRLMAGATVGEALAAVNARADAQRAAYQLCLFGDPDLRIAPLRTEAPQPRAARPRRPPRGVQLAAADPAARLIELCVRDGPVSQMLPKPARREASLRRYLRSALQGYRQSQDAATRARLRRACVAYAAARGSLRDLWIPHATMAADGKEACPHCGAPALRFAADLDHLGIAPRVLLNCGRCEIVADRPAALPVTATVTHDGVALRAEVEAGGWDAMLVASSRWPVAPRIRRWPAAADGGPAPFLSLADWRWPYPSEVAVVVAAGLDIAVLARTLRLRPGDEPPR